MNREELQKAWAKVIAKCWSDQSFKQRLIKDPNTVLKEYGIEVPHQTTCKIVENNDKTIYLVIPEKPRGDLSEEKLQKVAAAAACYPTPPAPCGIG